MVSLSGVLEWLALCTMGLINWNVDFLTKFSLRVAPLCLMCKMQLFNRMQFFHCRRLQWLCLLWLSGGTWESFQLRLQDIPRHFSNLSSKWDPRYRQSSIYFSGGRCLLLLCDFLKRLYGSTTVPRELLARQSCCDHSQKSSTHWDWKTPSYGIGWTYCPFCLLGWNLMVYSQQRW